jgi:hypothetical protein
MIKSIVEKQIATGKHMQSLQDPQLRLITLTVPSVMALLLFITFLLGVDISYTAALSLVIVAFIVESLMARCKLSNVMLCIAVLFISKLFAFEAIRVPMTSIFLLGTAVMVIEIVRILWRDWGYVVPEISIDYSVRADRLSDDHDATELVKPIVIDKSQQGASTS